MAEDGEVYEKEQIEMWLRKNNRSPNIGSLIGKQTVPVKPLKAAIQLMNYYKERVRVLESATLQAYDLLGGAVGQISIGNTIGSSEQHIGKGNVGVGAGAGAGRGAGRGTQGVKNGYAVGAGGGY